MECKCMVDVWFLCVCCGVDRLQGLALASPLLWRVADGRTIDETGHCAVVELHRQRCLVGVLGFCFVLFGGFLC